MSQSERAKRQGDVVDRKASFSMQNAGVSRREATHAPPNKLPSRDPALIGVASASKGE